METIKLPITTTAVGKSYWNQEGFYQADYDKLYEDLVPAIGMSNTLFGEVIRAVSRLSYEYYNNGNMNAHEMWEEEDDDYRTDINPFYVNFINLVREFFKENMPEAEGIMDEIEELILRGDNYDFSANEERPYVLMVDAAIYIIKSKAAKLEWAIKRSPEVPTWYTRLQKH